MTDRDAYRRAKDIDAKLIAEMQAAATPAATGPMTDDIRRSAIALYDRFTHDGMDRRLFMGRMVALAGSVAAAEALIAAISAQPAAAAIVPRRRQAPRPPARMTLGRRLQGLCRRAAYPLAESRPCW